MVPASRSLGSLALLALILSSAGCAQFRWSSEGPGAPGRKNIVPERITVSAAPVAPDLPPGLDDEPPAPFSSTERERITPIQPWVEQVARTHAIDPDLINGIIWVESRFVPRAKSSAGARGLMQLMPATANAMARQMGRPMARVYDPQFNIEAGSLYLLGLLDRYDGDETLALAAYNAGAGNVNRWMREDGELPPRSLEYVEHVLRARRRFVAMRPQLTDPDRTMLAVAPAPAPAKTKTEVQPRVPAPPPSRTRRPTPSTRRPAPTRGRSTTEPPRNPLAPDPDVYRPMPTPEPPLVETPYPPLDDRREASNGRSDTRRRPSPPPRGRTETPRRPSPPPRGRSERDEPVPIARPRTLPSVLD